jgi:hypothetical protein
MKVPAVVCRSKSGGAHIFFFFKTYISAGEFRDKASEIASYLGYGGCEIFPKQEQIIVERGDVGNFINLPYFDAKQTLRFAIKEDGEAATLKEFLQLVDGRTVEPEAFVGLTFGKQIDEFNEWAPCLNCMFGQGIPEGTRNTVMFAAAVGCFCNKSLCKTKKYGIGGHASNVDISGLCVVKSEPPVWFCDVAGQRVELTTDDLQTPQRFQKACMEQIRRMPPLMKLAEWQVIVSIMMEDMSEIEVPEELTYKGQFMDLLEAFCDGRVQAQSAEEISLGKPYTDEEDNMTYFKIEALMKYLRNNKFDTYSRGQIQERLKEINSGGAANGRKRFRTTKGDTHPLRVWWVPAFNREIQVPSIEVQDNEVPF